MHDVSNYGYLLVDVSRLFLRRFAHLAAPLGVTLQQAKALGNIARHEGICQTELSELCDIEPMTLGRIVDRMEKDRWIERRCEPYDRRANRLYLTTGAHVVLEQLARIGAQLRREAIEGVGKEDRAAFIRVLEQLYANLSLAGSQRLGKAPGERADRPVRASSKGTTTRTPKRPLRQA